MHHIAHPLCSILDTHRVQVPRKFPRSQRQTFLCIPFMMWLLYSLKSVLPCRMKRFGCRSLLVTRGVRGAIFLRSKYNALYDSVCMWDTGIRLCKHYLDWWRGAKLGDAGMILTGDASVVVVSRWCWGRRFPGGGWAMCLRLLSVGVEVYDSSNG